MTTVNIEGVLGEGAGSNLQNHRREFTRGVVILLHRIHKALSRSEVYGALAGHSHRGCTPLRCMLSLCLDGQLLISPHIQGPFRESLLVNLSAFCGGGYWVIDPSFSDTCLHPLGHQLVAVAGHRNTWILWFTGTRAHGSHFLFCGLIRHLVNQLMYPW